jgi:hypothetical protein
MDTSTFAQQEKVQKPAIRRKTDAYSFLGLTRPSIGEGQSAQYNEMHTDWLKPAI